MKTQNIERVKSARSRPESKKMEIIQKQRTEQKNPETNNFNVHIFTRF